MDEPREVQVARALLASDCNWCDPNLAVTHHECARPAKAIAKTIIADYEKQRKPDAAERVATEGIVDFNLCKSSEHQREFTSPGVSPQGDSHRIHHLADAFRIAVARDNAERDARDREREEAVRRLLGMYTVCTTPGCQCASGSIVIGVRRAFGWDKEGT